MVDSIVGRALEPSAPVGGSALEPHTRNDTPEAARTLLLESWSCHWNLLCSSESWTPHRCSFGSLLRTLHAHCTPPTRSMRRIKEWRIWPGSICSPKNDRKWANIEKPPERHKQLHIICGFVAASNTKRLRYYVASIHFLKITVLN